jgi:L-2-hydroxyglutarate oxidase LhgO
MERSELDVVIIGAGVVGLAIARELCQAGRDVVVLEAERSLGAHTSSRNSEVIHAGIYYPSGSLKAELCVEGKRALYRFCEEKSIPHVRLGKLLLAVDAEEVPALERLKQQAEANGVVDLSWLDEREIRELEPAVRAVRGLFSPSTGIVDSHALLQALKGDAEALGAAVVLRSKVVSGEIVSGERFHLDVEGEESSRIACRTLINSGGLFAPALARSLHGFPRELVPEGALAKGHYFTLSGPSPFRHLVYPMPEPGGLGVHVTLDLGKNARFGPDVSWVDEVDYAFDASRKERFEAAIRRYYPLLEPGRLQPGYTGIRPKLARATTAQQDFVVQGSETHGLGGLVNLFGIESPGLTAALALARRVRRSIG